MQEMVAKTKTILLLIPLWPRGMLWESIPQISAAAGKGECLDLGIWDTSTTMATPGTQLSHHPTADTPQGCQALDKCLNIPLKGLKGFLIFFFLLSIEGGLEVS